MRCCGAQARKDLDDAVAAKNLLELEIAGYERLLSGTAGAGGDGRATRDKNAIGGVAKALGGLGSAMGFGSDEKKATDKKGYGQGLDRARGPAETNLRSQAYSRALLYSRR